jgi:hypothetical protein
MMTITTSPILINPTAMTGAKIDLMILPILNFLRSSILFKYHPIDAIISSGANDTANQIVTILKTLIINKMTMIVKNNNTIANLVDTINISFIAEPFCSES